MGTDTQTLDTLDLERRVKEMYREVAEEPFKEFHFETGRALAERLGYPGVELDAIPAEAIDSFAGVGYYFELARITPGETVVDLGSGSGMDSFLAARQTGRERSRLRHRHDLGTAGEGPAARLRARHRERRIHRSAHRATPAPERLRRPCDLQRCDQPRPRQGGRVRRGRARPPPRRPARARRHRHEHAAPRRCDLRRLALGGLHRRRDDYREAIEAAGFELDDLQENDRYRFVSERAENATNKYGVKSVSLLAIKH